MKNLFPLFLFIALLSTSFITIDDTTLEDEGYCCRDCNSFEVCIDPVATDTSDTFRVYVNGVPFTAYRNDYIQGFNLVKNPKRKPIQIRKNSIKKYLFLLLFAPQFLL